MQHEPRKLFGTDDGSILIRWELLHHKQQTTKHKNDAQPHIYIAVISSYTCFVVSYHRDLTVYEALMPNMFDMTSHQGQGQGRGDRHILYYYRSNEIKIYLQEHYLLFCYLCDSIK
jgi:hypothetical protein